MTCFGISSIGFVNVGEMMLTAYSMSPPKKQMGTLSWDKVTPADNTYPRQASRISYLGLLQTSQVHLELIFHNKPESKSQ